MQEGLLYEGELPILIQSVEDFPSAETLNFLNEKNENFLRSCLITRELAEVEEHDEIAVELRRQEQKINLLLDMMSELLIQQKGLPESRRLRLTSTGLECFGCKKTYEAGDNLSIDLFIVPEIAKPLNLFAKVSNVGQESVELNFVGMNQALQDWLEKIIFRHHRRAVAQANLNK